MVHVIYTKADGTETLPIKFDGTAEQASQIACEIVLADALANKVRTTPDPNRYVSFRFA